MKGLVLLLLSIIAIYTAFGSYLLEMELIWETSKKIDVLRNEINYLSIKADLRREAIAPLVLRLFSYSKEGDSIKIFFMGDEIWSGDLKSLNFTYELENFGQIKFKLEDSRIVSEIEGMPYRYTLKSFYEEELAYVIQDTLDIIGRIEKAIERDKANVSTLENKLRDLSVNPFLPLFLLAPLFSIVVQFLILRELDKEVARKYLGVLANPYILIPSAALYISFFYLTLAFHSGTLMPLHVISALYILTSISSIVSPIIYIYEKIIK